MSKLGLHLLIHDFQTGNTVRSDTESIIVGRISLKKCNYCAYLGKSMKLSGIISNTIMNQTWYRTHLAVTLFDLGEVIKGHTIKNKEKKYEMVVFRHKCIKIW